jgi:hypothetical protein
MVKYSNRYNKETHYLLWKYEEELLKDRIAQAKVKQGKYKTNRLKWKAEQGLSNQTMGRGKHLAGKK